MVIRMRDVAARAGVSTQTVSRVVSGSPLVTPQTAARVRAAMQEMGYLGNEAAGALKRGRSHTIGLLFPFLTMSIWSDVTVGIEALAHERGYSLLLCDTSGPIDKESHYLSLLMRHRVAGIIYTQPRCQPETHPACAALVSSGLPVVVISARRHDLPYPHVRTDDERAGYVAIRHLQDLGRRAIALVATGRTGSPDLLPLSSAVADRLAGARRALDESGDDPYRYAVHVVPNTADGGYTAADALLRHEPRPDAIFATTDAIALGILEALHARGVGVPDDIAVSGHDDLFASSATTPSLTTIAPPHQEMGRVCTDLLLRALDGETLPPRTVLDARFIARESTIGPRPGAQRGHAVPLSDPEAWRRWRTDTAGPIDRPGTPLTTIRLDEVQPVGG